MFIDGPPDYWTTGLLDYGTTGLLDYWIAAITTRVD